MRSLVVFLFLLLAGCSLADGPNASPVQTESETYILPNTSDGLDTYSISCGSGDMVTGNCTVTPSMPLRANKPFYQGWYCEVDLGSVQNAVLVISVSCSEPIDQ